VSYKYDSNGNLIVKTDARTDPKLIAVLDVPAHKPKFICGQDAANPNTDILSGNIMHDPRHTEQVKRGLSYNQTYAVPMEMEASQFVLGIIETRGWSASSIEYFRKDASRGHLPPRSGWKDKSTEMSRRKVFDVMKPRQ
jgi:hypothetical protein